MNIFSTQQPAAKFVFLASVAAGLISVSVAAAEVASVKQTPTPTTVQSIEAHAQHHRPDVAWTPASLRVVLADMPKGDAANGKALHTGMFCASCHGAAGESLSASWPSLSGQRAEYTYKMLLDYQSGLRKEDARAGLMNVVSTLLSKQDMADLAAFYAAQPLPAASHVADAATSQMIRRGEPSRLVTPCASCHGLHGQGGINETPALAGLSRDYFIRTMQHFREGTRHNDSVQAMRAFAKPLTDAEIISLADYYASATQEVSGR